MQLTLLNLLQRKEAVDYVYSDVQGLRLESELPMHVNDPLDQESTARVLDLGRHLHLLQVIGVHLELDLLFTHVLVDFLGEFGHHLWVTDIELISENHSLAHVTSPCGESLFIGISYGSSNSGILLGYGREIQLNLFGYALWLILYLGELNDWGRSLKLVYSDTSLRHVERTFRGCASKAIAWDKKRLSRGAPSHMLRLLLYFLAWADRSSRLKRSKRRGGAESTQRLFRWHTRVHCPVCR